MMKRVVTKGWTVQCSDVRNIQVTDPATSLTMGHVGPDTERLDSELSVVIAQANKEGWEIVSVVPLTSSYVLGTGLSNSAGMGNSSWGGGFGFGGAFTSGLFVIGKKSIAVDIDALQSRKKALADAIISAQERLVPVEAVLASAADTLSPTELRESAIQRLGVEARITGAKQAMEEVRTALASLEAAIASQEPKGFISRFKSDPVAKARNEAERSALVEKKAVLRSEFNEIEKLIDQECGRASRYRDASLNEEVVAAALKQQREILALVEKSSREIEQIDEEVSSAMPV